MKKQNLSRRHFVATTGTAVAGGLMINPLSAAAGKRKKKIALVGTGIRAILFWGHNLVQRYGDSIEFVGLADINPGRLAYARRFMQLDCPVFTDFDEMLRKTKPDLLIVTTVDATHDEFIVKALEHGMDVITEKPMTTDEVKTQRVLDAERKSGKTVTVGLNYRYGWQNPDIRKLLIKEEVGKLTSVDFHWYLNTYHGASYFRRWHGLRKNSGTLLVHKATHHFDLLNWWIDSDPVEVKAYGALEFYGKNHPFRGDKCRTCPHKQDCRFYWDVTKSGLDMNLYVKNEKYDGYIRDNCLWREEIDIFDKMSVQIKYANDVVVNYSLTTYSPYEGWRIAFNGFNGRIESWHGIPWLKNGVVSQKDAYMKEMVQETGEKKKKYQEIMVMKDFEDYRFIRVPERQGGHGGGDPVMQDYIFLTPDGPDPLRQSAGTRDGALAVLVGIAARKSIDTGKTIRIADLTDIPLQSKKPAVKKG